MNLYIQSRGIKQGNERKKKQSTIEFYHLISQESHKFASYIDARSGNDAVPASRISEDKDFKDVVTRYLSLMERFSVGIHLGVYDFDTFG